MFRRAIRRLLNTVLGLVVLAPVLALLPAAVLDSGPAPEYRTRFSLFPLALASLDPLLWTCLWNSVAVALVVAVVSLVIGVVLGGMIARSRFLGRPLLEALITAPAVIPPAFFALGLLGLFGSTGSRDFGRLLDPSLRTQADPARFWPWLVWAWAASIPGIAMVVLATRSAYGRIDPSHADAARLAGARSWRIWWTLIWPTLRPSVASIAYLLYMLNLADPGCPLVLGLRRTLSFQMVATALGPDPFPRLAALGLMVLTFTLAGLVLIWWRRGFVFDPINPPGRDRESVVGLSQVATWPRRP